MGNELSVVLCAQHPGVVSELLAEGCGSCFLTRLLGMAGGYWGASLMRQDSRRPSLWVTGLGPGDRRLG